MDQTLTHRIRERAYHIWMETGGTADQNWLQAETELRQPIAPVAYSDQPGKKRVRKTTSRKQ